MNKKYLYYIAAAIWGIPGAILMFKGIQAYMMMPQQSLWWLFLITLFVLVSFFFMFCRIVDKYSARIAALPEKTSIFQTFPLRGWILVVFMMCLGMVLKRLSIAPAEFTASFYSGLGPMLVYSAFRFISKSRSFRFSQR